MLQASLLIEPESYETNYNLALAFSNLATKLTREEKFHHAGECFRQAKQYYRNATQLKHVDGSDVPDKALDIDHTNTGHGIEPGLIN